jgi:hypothetical protein
MNNKNPPASFIAMGAEGGQEECPTHIIIAIGLLKPRYYYILHSTQLLASILQWM